MEESKEHIILEGMELYDWYGQEATPDICTHVEYGDWMDGIATRVGCTGEELHVAFQTRWQKMRDREKRTTINKSV